MPNQRLSIKTVSLANTLPIEEMISEVMKEYGGKDDYEKIARDICSSIYRDSTEDGTESAYSDEEITNENLYEDSTLNN
jgi:hypothetical protein